MTPTETAMKATLQAYVDRTNAGDAAGLIALFAPEAWMEDPIGTPIRTHREIAQLLNDGIAYGARITPVAPIRGSHGNEAAIAFEVEFTPPGGQKIRIRSLDACTFDEQARITSLRAFWGPDDVEQLA